jgi:alanine-glyoxylate transaminase/serine-glyoxylate transaminase/serine-pyruvate transaminase
MSKPMIGHLDPEFIELMDSMKELVRATFQTANEASFIVSAPGSAGMETCLVNLLEPGDEAIICINGVFGHRMADIARRIGAIVHEVHAPWGEIIETAQIEEALRHVNPKLVAIVHAETSTGVLQPLEEIGKLVKSNRSLFVVDTVTSYCGTDVKVDEWGIDAVYSGTQKCLSAPPGLSPVSFSSEAVEIIMNRKTKVQSWFLDVSMVINYWSGQKRAYHHTAPISAIYGLYEAYRIVMEEGLDARFNRHLKNYKLLHTSLTALGLEYVVDPDIRLPMLNAVRIPRETDDLYVRKRLLHEYNIEIGGGLGDFAGKIWRIGLMGQGSNVNHIHLLTSALKELL